MDKTPDKKIKAIQISDKFPERTEAAEKNDVKGFSAEPTKEQYNVSYILGDYPNKPQHLTIQVEAFNEIHAKDIAMPLLREKHRRRFFQITGVARHEQ
jgi:hypothetical protein